MTFTRFTLYALLTLALVLLYPVANADVLNWTPPTQRGNGTAYNTATEQSANKVYKLAGTTPTLVATVTGNLTTWDSGSVGCVPINWAVTSVDKTLPPVGPLESPLSVAVLGPVDTVGCAPKSPGIVKVTAH